jgi:predicted transcriptional regulator of viral defense system
VLDLIHELGIVRGGDLERRGISRRYLPRLTAKGKLERVSRGLYAHPDTPATENQSLAEVAKLYPNAVVCLVSALQLHRLTSQLPRQVWIAIGSDARAPVRPPVRVRVVRFSGTAFTEGVEHHIVGAVEVPVYGVAKTVADCFKLRNKVGLDVALEALREVLAERRSTVDEILAYSRICRVENVIRPYLEALV